MQIIELENIHEQKLQKLANEISLGKIFIFPTSTVYGVGTNAFDDNAVKKIYEIKGREYKKPLIVLASNIQMVKEIVENLNEVEEKLISTFWPGELTIILRKNKKIPDIVTSGGNELAVRIDKNEFLLNFIETSKVPIVAPSANYSGDSCQIDCQCINQDLKNKVDFVIDAGKIDKGKESTIVKVINSRVKIIREGKISKDEIKEAGFIIY